MEDLDSLLEDLGRGKSSSTVKKQRPPSSRVDLNELENLMEDLAAPTSKPMPEPVPARLSVPAAQSYNSGNSNNYNSQPSNPPSNRASVNNTPAPVTPTPVNSNYSNSNSNSGSSISTMPAPSRATPAANMDDLDALMESLNASSSKSQRRSVQTTPVNATSPSSSSNMSNNNVQPTVAPKQTSSSSYNANVTPISNPAPERKPDPAPTAQPRSNPMVHNPPPAATKKGDDLDSLLQNLTSQMNNIDSENPASRGTCYTCRGAILGEVIQAVGKTFHPEHFTCGNCRTPLGTRNFFEQNGTPHCEDCYMELFCPKCAHCNQGVLDRCITALGKKWHVDHFICTQCLKPFAGGNFYERDGRPYCEADFYGMYAPKCASCNDPIRGDCINALGSQWHPEHFACTYCQKSFSGGSFFEFGGKPYCETHYHQQTGSLCSGCGKPITGRCVNALEKKWHPEHFVCAFCMNPLAGGSFTEHNNKAYCKECHGKLFGGN